MDKLQTSSLELSTNSDRDEKCGLESDASSSSCGARCSSVVRAFTHGAMGRRVDPSWGGPIELFPASAPRLV